LIIEKTQTRFAGKALGGEIMPISLVITAVGTIAIVLMALERVLPRKALYPLVIVTLLVNVSLGWLQYYENSSTRIEERKRQEDDLAFSLWAYTSGELPALKHLTEQRHRYILGYYYFKNCETGSAIDALSDAIKHDAFVAPAKYILAVIARTQSPSDLTEATKLLESAIAYDPKYSSLYMERGILRAQAEPDAAIADLARAVDLNKVHCYTITRNSRDPEHPLHRLRGELSFQKLREHCELREKALGPVPVADRTPKPQPCAEQGKS
jgi:tetratricopeptide (TPR) repeat protein